MSGEGFPNALIKPCQSPAAPTDTRFLYSFGPFGRLKPGDTLKISVALVSGMTLSDMFNNAQRAHDLYNNNYVLGVSENQNILPSGFLLMQNHPNPYNPSTTIQFTLPHESHVTLKVYNLLGQEVQTLVNDTRTAGTYNVSFDAGKLSSGVYFYTLRADRFIETKKMAVIK